MPGHPGQLRAGAAAAVCCCQTGVSRGKLSAGQFRRLQFDPKHEIHLGPGLVWPVVGPRCVRVVAANAHSTPPWTGGFGG
jgi:hypothetical protein